MDNCYYLYLQRNLKFSITKPATTPPPHICVCLEVRGVSWGDPQLPITSPALLKPQTCHVALVASAGKAFLFLHSSHFLPKCHLLIATLEIVAFSSPYASPLLFPRVHITFYTTEHNFFLFPSFGSWFASLCKKWGLHVGRDEVPGRPQGTQCVTEAGLSWGASGLTTWCEAGWDPSLGSPPGPLQQRQHWASHLPPA